MFDTIKKYWNSAKDFFNRSETIFLGWVTTFAGLVTTLVGAADWSPIVSLVGTDTGFSWRQVATLGVGSTVYGLTQIYARNRNAEWNNVPPVKVEIKPVAVKVKTKIKKTV